MLASAALPVDRKDRFMHAPIEPTIRPATLDDRETLQRLIAESAVALSVRYYEPSQIAAAIEKVFGIDTTLIEDGTYFVSEIEGVAAGCGGWSKRATLFGGDQFSVRDAALLDPMRQPARIRAFFVHPSQARKGIARAILERCETEARARGFRAFELMATLPGVPFYLACDYAAGERVSVEITPGLAIEFVPMHKP